MGKKAVQPIWKSFPVLDPRIRLHRTPVQTHLIRERGDEWPEDLPKDIPGDVPEEGPENATNDGSTPRTTVATVNEDAGRLLELCDGSRTAEEVLRGLTRTGRRFSRSSTGAFLRQAQSAGHILLRPAPAAHLYRHTGSFEEYFPAHALVEVTDACNLRCSYCYHGKQTQCSPGCQAPACNVEPAELPAPSREPRMTLEEFRTALLEWKALGLTNVELTGGEPMLAPFFGELLRFCAAHFSITAVLTNGTRLTTLDPAVLKSAPNKILFSVSLDGSTPGAFSEITGGTTADFERILCGIRRLAKLDQWVNVSMTVLKETVGQVVPTARLAAGLGARHFSASFPLPIGGGEEHSWSLNPEAVNALGAALDQIEREMPGFIAIPPSVAAQHGACEAGRKSAALSATGMIRSCPLMPQALHSGSVRSAGVAAVLRGEPFRSLSRIPFPDESTCDPGCSMLSVCRGCLARACAVNANGKTTCGWRGRSGFADWCARAGEGSGA